MKLIPLTKGFSTIVDDDVYAWASKKNWRAHTNNKGKVYASRDQRGIRLHTEILGRKGGHEIDHINGDTLDNRRCNLRFATRSQNMMNRKGRSLSGFKGVTHVIRSHKWKAMLTINGRYHYLGCHNTKEEAAKAYDQKAIELFGSYALLNFPLHS